jgi:hypothetical protein
MHDLMIMTLQEILSGPLKRGFRTVCVTHEPRRVDLFFFTSHLTIKSLPRR